MVHGQDGRERSRQHSHLSAAGGVMASSFSTSHPAMPARPGSWPRVALCLAAVAALVVAFGPISASASAASTPTRLIIDTDFGQWWDDVAALAAAHSAADQGRVRILGVV